MTEAKLFHVVYFVLLSLLACSFNNIELAAAEDKSDKNVGSGEDGGGKWLWGARGRQAGLFPAIGGGIGGSIGGSIPGLGIGASVGGGISGGAIPGIGIGGYAGRDIGGGVGVTGSGTDQVNSGHSTGNGGGRGEGTGTGCGYGSTRNGGRSGSGGGSGFDGGYVGGGIGGGGIGSGSGGGWMMAPEWLGQPLYCTPMRSQGDAGIELQLGRFISSNLSGNSHDDDDGIGIPSNGTDGAGAGAHHDDHQQTPDQVSSAEAPMSG